MPIDHVIKLYSETFRSPYLHYSFWDDPRMVDPEKLSLKNLVAAQERYIEHLASFIPRGVESILDVSSGIGGVRHYCWKRVIPYMHFLPINIRKV